MSAVIGTRVFALKKDALAEIYAFRDRYLNGAETTEEDEFLRDLVALHSRLECTLPGEDGVRKAANNLFHGSKTCAPQKPRAVAMLEVSHIVPRFVRHWAVLYTTSKIVTQRSTSSAAYKTRIQ